jgi:hypothetical protein
MMLLGNINAIPFRRRFGGGGGMPFPYIPGMIARYSALGLTNEQMAENPVWKDLTGNGHDLQMKNFGWAGMSGVNGYEQNYKGNRWTYASSRADIFYTGNFINVTSVKINGVQLYYQAYGSQPSFTVPSYSVKVSGLMEGQNIDYRSSNGLILNIKEDGIYRLPEFEFSANGGFYGFQLNKIQESCDITIEQLPLYPGALVFDGVDDYGVCENFPILTKEKGYTVVALRQWITTPNDNLFYGLMTNGNSRTDGAFVFEDFNGDSKSSFSFGGYTIVESGTRSMPFTYQTSTSYNGKAINIGSLEKGVDIFYVGRMGSRSYYVNAVVWEICILDHDATEEELQKIQDYYKQEYPWLFPDQAWTVVGKTNEDTDRATIANITGNGNNLVLSNFGFAENSGYGLYGDDFSKWYIGNVNRIDATKTTKSFNVKAIKQANIIQLYRQSSGSQQPFVVSAFKVKITGLTEEQTLRYQYYEGGASAYLSIDTDGIYNLPSFDFPAMGNVYGFIFGKIQESCDITIEQIPEYEGYLVTDGVDDKIQSSPFLMGKDWTMVGEWEFIQKENMNAGVIKIYQIYFYNNILGARVYINSTSINTTLNINKILGAVGDGTIYDEDWNTTKVNSGDLFDIVSSLLIGNVGNTYFTKLAFKNLAIYPTVLSKEDCIKAYNYLQTLKAK